MTEKVILVGHNLGVNCFCWSQKIQVLYSGGLDNKICVWDPLAGKFALFLLYIYI
jgi:WD40 repeat protein